MKKELFAELLESVKQAKAIERGEMKPSRAFKLDPKHDVVKARKSASRVTSIFPR